VVPAYEPGAVEAERWSAWPVRIAVDVPVHVSRGFASHIPGVVAALVAVPLALPVAPARFGRAVIVDAIPVVMRA
jgi:hypothetical protein